MKSKSYFDSVGVSEGRSNFGDSLTIQSLEPSTRITNILKRYMVTGILPSQGKAQLPADVVFGGITFDEVSERLTQAQGHEQEYLAPAMDSEGVSPSAGGGEGDGSPSATNEGGEATHNNEK